MRIGVDGRVLRATREPRGVAVYLERLLDELVGLSPDDEYVVLIPGDARPGAVPSGVDVVTAGRAVHARGALTGRPRLDVLLGRPDLVWMPAPAPVAISPDAVYVLTVHDLSFVHRPRDFSAYERLWHRLARLRRLGERARLVITDTEVVREQLLDEWQLGTNRVRVVPPGPGRAAEAADREQGRPEPAEEGNAEAAPEAGRAAPDAGRAAPEAGRAAPEAGRHVLAVGGIEPRKLPLLLVRAHALARSRGLGAGLVLAGDGPLANEVQAAGATVLRSPTDAQLEAAYADALCLACVSREEGFGFTPLEALAAGVPPVVSDLPVFRETLAEAALRVPAGDVDALAGALLRIEREPELRARIVDAGRARLRDFSWESAARATRALFEEAAG
jgi:glycosyltransferase involved in cell wall biosynthesis